MPNDRFGSYLMILAGLVVVVAAGAVLAVYFGKAAMPQAAMLAPLSLVAAGSGAIAVLMLIDDESDESFELGSHWGGLGGGLGGWRLSRPAALGCIMLLAVLAMFAVAGGHSEASGGFPETGSKAAPPP